MATCANKTLATRVSHDTILCKTPPAAPVSGGEVLLDLTFDSHAFTSLRMPWTYYTSADVGVSYLDPTGYYYCEYLFL